MHGGGYTPRGDVRTMRARVGAFLGSYYNNQGIFSKQLRKCLPGDAVVGVSHAFDKAQTYS